MPFYPTLVGKPSFNDAQAEQSAKNFKDAMKGFGTDEKKIIQEITSMTNQQRQIVKEKYLNMYGHTLDEDLKAELNGCFEDIIVALLKPRFEYEAECIRKAISGLGTREHVIIEILSTKDSTEIEKLKQAYKSIYQRDLEEDLKSEEKGPLGRIFRSLATGNRPTGSFVDTELAKQEAQELYDAGEGMFGTDENEFVRILVSRSFSQLRATFEEYKKISGKDLEDAIKSETEHNLQKALVAIVRSIRNRPAYYARQLHKAMDGPGTKEHDLIRILVSRCEADMGAIKREYFDIYRKSLYEDLKKELRGDFEDIVLALVGQD